MIRRRVRWTRLTCVVAGWALAWPSFSLARSRDTETTAVVRSVPSSLPEHPGNVFLDSEEVALGVPAGFGPAWQAFDYDGRRVAGGDAANGRISLCRLPVGYYDVRGEGLVTNRISVGVLARLAAPTPLSSPIGLDIAMAWFYPAEQMEAVANLATLAGVNWVRDRLNWIELETQKGHYAPHNRSDASVRAEVLAGLRVLEVNHYSPSWANTNLIRFPADLRDAYDFYRELARRWRGEALAFEPWNEADIDVFGGHTGSEMASLQKAAYLGLKAGNPSVIACQNVFASHNRATLADFRDNQVWPYFDTFNLHHYIATEAYPRVYADFRAVSAGRPIWVSECNLPVWWSGDEHLKEPGPREQREQAERVAQIFAAALNERAAAVFYFTLAHYAESQTQYGLLRPDLTPRPAFVALAAVGRLLAGAAPLGTLRSTNPAVRAFAFAARPDGHAREVVVAWSTNGEANCRLPVAPEAAFDHLGRRLVGASARLRVTGAPVFAILPPGSLRNAGLEAPAVSPKRQSGAPSPVILQGLWPQDEVLPGLSAYRLWAGRVETVPVYAYNFGTQAARGHLRIDAPVSWDVSLPAEVTLPPGGRMELPLKIQCRSEAPTGTERLRIDGDFGAAGRTRLSLPIRIEASRTPTPAVALAVPEADHPWRWTAVVSGGGPARIADAGKGVMVEAAPRTKNRWVYPRLDLQPGETLDAQVDAVAVDLTLQEGNGKFSVIFEEANGSDYIVEFQVQPKKGARFEAIALVDHAVWGATWSEPDSNGQLDLEKVKSIRIGCNTKDERVRFTIQNLRWLKFHPAAKE